MKDKQYGFSSGDNSSERHGVSKLSASDFTIESGIRHRWLTRVLLCVICYCCLIIALNAQFTYVQPVSGYTYALSGATNTFLYSTYVSNGTGIGGTAYNQFATYTQQALTSNGSYGYVQSSNTLNGTTTITGSGATVTSNDYESPHQYNFEQTAASALNDIDINVQSGGIDFSQSFYSASIDPTYHNGVGITRSVVGDNSIEDNLAVLKADMGSAASGYTVSSYYVPSHWNSSTPPFNGAISTAGFTPAPIGAIGSADWSLDQQFQSLNTVIFRKPTITPATPNGTTAIPFPFYDISVSGSSITGSQIDETLVVPTTDSYIISACFDSMCTFFVVIYAYFRLVKTIRNL